MPTQEIIFKNLCYSITISLIILNLKPLIVLYQVRIPLPFPILHFISIELIHSTGNCSSFKYQWFANVPNFNPLPSYSWALKPLYRWRKSFYGRYLYNPLHQLRALIRKANSNDALDDDFKKKKLPLAWIYLQEIFQLPQMVYVVFLRTLQLHTSCG